MLTSGVTFLTPQILYSATRLHVTFNITSKTGPLEFPIRPLSWTTGAPSLVPVGGRVPVRLHGCLLVVPHARLDVVRRELFELEDLPSHLGLVVQHVHQQDRHIGQLLLGHLLKVGYLVSLLQPNDVFRHPFSLFLRRFAHLPSPGCHRMHFLEDANEALLHHLEGSVRHILLVILHPGLPEHTQLRL